ncbi:hypothetical protein BH09ACT8_BH09ACT8_03530 [soil metagenome]
MLLAALALSGAAIVAVASATGALRLPDPEQAPPSAERSAQTRCESEVRKQLASPSTADITDIRTENSTLDLDARDKFPLMLEESLKGVDTARISVLNVSGVVGALTESGSTIRDPFDCRAYFVDGSLAHTLVVFDHDH